MTGPRGEPGATCTVRQNLDGTATVQCPDGTSVILTAGTSATEGAIRYAHRFPGQTAGEKIANALADIEDGGGIVDARGLSGALVIDRELRVGTAWTRPVALLLGYGVFEVRATLVVSMQSSITGMPVGSSVGGAQPTATVLKASAGAMLDSVIRIGDGTQAANGLGAVIQDLIADGNRAAGGTSAGPGRAVILVNNRAGRVDLTRVTAQHGAGAGIEIFSRDDDRSSSCCAKLTKVMAIENAGSGLLIYNSNDVFVNQSEFEFNGLDGIELSGAQAMRITNSDLGGNGRFGIHGYATSGYTIITGNQFGNQKEHDLAFGDASSGQQLISGNFFIGSGARRAAATYSAIQLRESGGNTVVGNRIDLNGTLADGGPGGLYAGIQIIAPAAGFLPNLVSGNVVSGPVAPGGGAIMVPVGTTLGDNLVFP